MSNIYKLQRYVNNSWVDVQLGQMNAGSGDSSTSLEHYLTLSQIEDQFVSASLIRGDITKQTLEQGVAGALGRYSSSFGNSIALGKGSIAFGGDVSEGWAQTQVVGYWNVSDEIFYMKIDDLDDTVSSNISELEKQIIRATAENENYFLVITKVEEYQTNYYRFTFSTTEGDWENFKLQLGGLVNHNSTSSVVRAQFTFIDHVARGDNSLVSGKSNIASGAYSHALGWYLNATGPYQTVVGKWNATNNDALFIVGGGSYAGRKNILEAYDNAVKIYQPVSLSQQCYGGRVGGSSGQWTSGANGAYTISLPSDGLYVVKVEYKWSEHQHQRMSGYTLCDYKSFSYNCSFVVAYNYGTNSSSDAPGMSEIMGVYQTNIGWKFYSNHSNGTWTKVEDDLYTPFAVYFIPLSLY